MADNIGIPGFENEVQAQLGRSSFVPYLPFIGCPALVLTGREDYMVPVSIHEMMAAQLPNSRLIIIEHCGHLSTMEQPEIVTRAMRDWLTSEGIWKRTA